MKIFIDRSNWYRLLETESGGLILTILIGGAAESIVSIPLTDVEASFLKEHPGTADSLALNVSHHYDAYRSRAIVPAIWGDE